MKNPYLIDEKVIYPMAICSNTQTFFEMIVKSIYTTGMSATLVIISTKDNMELKTLGDVNRANGENLFFSSCG